MKTGLTLMDTSIKISREYLKTKDLPKTSRKNSLLQHFIHKLTTNNYYAEVQCEDGRQYKTGSLKTCERV